MRTEWAVEAWLMRLFCFGFGYAAESLARRLSARTSALAGTRTSLAEAGDAPLGVRARGLSRATPRQRRCASC